MAELYITENRSETVQRLIDYFVNAQDAANIETPVSDFNPGSEVRNLFEAEGATVNDLLYLIKYLLDNGYVHTAEGVYLDMIAILVNCKRKQAVQSTGSITVSCSEAKTYDLDIPAGTIIFPHLNPDLQFKTTTDVTFPTGNTSLLIENIQAVNGGIDGNIAPGLIDTFYEPIEDLTVTNSAAFTGGRDEESDILFRPRILEAGRGLKTGSISWYKTVAGAVTGVHDVVAVNNSGGVDILLYVNGVEKPTPQSVVEAVEALFNDEEHEIGGVQVGIYGPGAVNQNIVATITLRSGYVWNEVSQQIKDDIACYFNGGITSYGTEYPGLNGGEDIIKTVLQLIIANNPGVLDYNLTTPAANVSIVDYQAAKLGTITLTQTT